MAHPAVMQNLVAQPAPLFQAVSDVVGQDRRELSSESGNSRPTPPISASRHRVLGGTAMPAHSAMVVAGFPHDLRIEAALRSDHQFGQLLGLRLVEKVRALSGELRADLFIERRVDDDGLFGSADRAVVEAGARQNVRHGLRARRPCAR